MLRRTLTLLLLLPLAACGGASREKREQVVRCTNLAAALIQHATEPAIAAALRTAGPDLTALAEAGRILAAQLPPTRQATLRAEAEAQAATLRATGTVQGITNLLNACLVTFHALGQD